MRAIQKFSLPAITVAAFALITLNACAGERTEVRAMDDAQYVLSQEPLPVADSISGNYLAGRFAQRHQDWSAAQSYLNEVVTFNEGNADLLEKTFLLTLGAGNYPRAADLAKKILAVDPSDEITRIFLACDALARNDAAAADQYLKALPEDGFGAYTKPLLGAWTLMAAGKKAEALQMLAENSSDEDPTYHIHAGLIEELANNPEAAGAHYAKAMGEGLTLHSAVLVSDFFLRHHRPDASDAIYTSLGKMFPFNPFIASLSQQDKNRAPAPNITRAADGAAYALYDLATILYEKHAYDSAKIYGSLVQLLKPDAPFAMLMKGDIAALHKLYPEALEAYNGISQGSPLYWLSRMRVAEVYELDNRVDLAVALLTELSQHEETRTNALVSLGDIQRRHENFAGALAAYDAALANIGTLTEEHWPVIYARGMSQERLNNWQMAEKDLLKALELQPDNPQILNFIGYSWIDKGMHMEKALDYIHKAVTMRPDDGYILDSYGWAFYRIGQFDSAVKWMEEAVQHVQDDPTILDHLGDAYWQVGRHNEALFKWRRAEEVTNDATFKGTLEQKINHGLVRPMPVNVSPAHKEAKL